MKQEKRITLYKKVWCKIRYWQTLRDVSDAQLASDLQVGERTLHEYDKSAKTSLLKELIPFWKLTRWN